MTHLSIVTFTGSLQNQSTLLVNARNLHQLLQIKTPFHKWISRRLSESRFRKNIDFIERTTLSNRGFFKTESIEYHLTLRMAGHLCLMENNEIGDKIRDQVIEHENQIVQEISLLKAENTQLKQQITLVPAFIRDPDLYLKLLEQAQTLLFTIYPEYKKIIHYRDIGLNNSEIAKLIGITKPALERRLAKMFSLGLLERKQRNQFTPTQLTLSYTM